MKTHDNFYGIWLFWVVFIIATAAVATQYMKADAPQVVTISTAEWECTKLNVITEPSLVLTGRMFQPAGIIKSSCTEWTRK